LGKNQKDLHKLLIIEEEPGTASVVKRALEAGYSLAPGVVVHPTAALEMISESGCDLAIVVSRSAGGETLELLGRIAAEEGNPAVILVDGTADEKTAADALAAGASGYVTADRLMPVLLLDAVRKALDESRRDFYFTSNALDSLPDMFAIFDLEGNMVKWNRATSEVMGYSDEEMARMKVYGSYDPEEMPKIASAVGDIIEKGHARFEASPSTKDDRRLHLDINAALLRDEAGNPRYICGISRDISERREADDEIRRINQELEGYAHTISHDLKGPLSTVLMSLDLLQVALDDADSGVTRDEVLQMVRRNTCRMYERVNALLSLAVAGRFPSEVEALEVGSVVAEVLEDLAGPLDQGAVTVKVDADLGVLVANRTQVAQVFSNLITNAIAHNDRNDPVVEVRLLGREDGRLRFQVRDNGPGIPEECLQHVFEPFYTVGDTGNTGIGLSLVRKIVNSYGGEIEVCNDGGACFEFTLGGIGAPSEP
jgi:PAS domain S-box-containing protein